MPEAPEENDIEVVIIRKGQKIAVKPFSDKLDVENKPYYLRSESGLIFSNHQYGDEYKILDRKTVV